MPTSILGGWATGGATNPSQWQWINANPAFLQRIVAATPAYAKPMPNYLAGYTQAKGVLDAYNAAARTKPHNWWQSGYTTNPLPGWTPPATMANQTPPWVPSKYPAPIAAQTTPLASNEVVRTMAKPSFTMRLPSYGRRTQQF